MRKFFFVFVVLVCLVLVVAAEAAAAKTSVSTSPNPVTVGQSFTITLCDTGGKDVAVSEYAPDGTLVARWFVINSATQCVDLQAAATTQTGDYLIVVGSAKNPDSGNVSTVETVS